MAALLEKPKQKAFILSRTIAFVPHPAFRGVWLKVHPCVVLIKCAVCQSKPGIPCMSRQQYRNFSHGLRRDSASKVAFSELGFLAVTYGELASIKERFGKES